MQQQILQQAFTEISRSRRSVRGFLSTPVRQKLLQEIFEIAQTAPSNCNTQPWQVHVASGNACEALKEGMHNALNKGAYAMDFPYTGKYEGVYRERQHDAATQLYGAMGIKREDRERRNEAFMKNFEFFGAPHVAFLFLPEQFGIREAADLGMYAQNLLLAMTAAGIASCPQTALSFSADLVREVLGVPENLKLLFGISFGYEDREAPANNVRVGRAALNEVVIFHQ